MSKNHKKSSCHTNCPDCGARLSTQDHGYTICYECGWSWAPAQHFHAQSPIGRPAAAAAAP